MLMLLLKEEREQNTLKPKLKKKFESVKSLRLSVVNQAKQVI